MAEKVITATIREPTLADIDSIHIARDSDDPTTVILVATYTLTETSGVAFQQKTMEVPLSEAQKTTLVDYINGQILPLISAAEGPFV